MKIIEGTTMKVKETVNPKYSIEYKRIFDKDFEIVKTSLETDIDKCFDEHKYLDEIEVTANINGKEITTTGYYQKSVSDIKQEQERGECILYFDTYHFYGEDKTCYYFTVKIKLGIGVLAI